MSGIITKYLIDKDYFKVGEVYRIRLSSNNLKNCILTNVTDEKVTFKYFDSKEVKVFELSVNELRFRGFDIVKLKTNYVDGKFEIK